MNRRVLFLVSDGEQTVNTDRQAIITAANTFKSLGGVVIAVGVRASGAGFDLLERVATPGFFLNATASTAAGVLTKLNYLKSILCAGHCVPPGDEWLNVPATDYSSFLQWEVAAGQVNLVGETLLNLLDVSGLYVELNGGTPGTIKTIDQFALVAGRDYRISLDAAGNQRMDIPGQGLKIYVREVGIPDTDPNVFEQSVYPDWDGVFNHLSYNFNAVANASVRLHIEQIGGAPNIGNLIDNVTFEETTTLTPFISDTFDSENLQYIPPRCGPSASAAAIDDPPAPTVEGYSTETGDDLEVFHKYAYGCSWLTNEGETKITPVVWLPLTSERSLSSRILTLPAPPPRATKVRIWRSLGEVAAITAAGAGAATANGQYLERATGLDRWISRDSQRYAIQHTGGGDPLLGWRMMKDPGDLNFYSTAGTVLGLWDTTDAFGTAPPPTFTDTREADADEAAMFLLVELPIEQTAYVDNESRDTFEARYEPTVTAPTANTTAAAEGGLGLGHAACCDYYAYSYASTPEEQNLVPSMTGATAPSGEASASSDDGFNFPWFAFDGTPLADGWNSTSLPASLVYEFPEAKTIHAYGFVGSGLLTTPKTWTFEGSNNGADWDVLDSQNGAFPQGVFHRFDLAAPATYIHFRMLVTATLFSYVSISQLQLLGYVSVGGGGANSFTSSCPDCDPGTPGAQVADSPALPNIETTDPPSPPTSFTTKQCAVCPPGFINLSATIVPAMSGFATPTGVVTASTQDVTKPAWRAFDQSDLYWQATAVAPQWLAYKFVAAQTVAAYGIRVRTGVNVTPKDWQVQGSADGSTWTTLDTRAEIGWPGVTKFKRWIIATPASFLYYRLNITGENEIISIAPGPPPVTPVSIVEFELYTIPVDVCETRTASTLALATSEALAAATALLRCVQVWSVTESFRARCPAGQLGADQERSATRLSLNSEQEARADARAAATTAAMGDLECLPTS